MGRVWAVYLHLDVVPNLVNKHVTARHHIKPISQEGCRNVSDGVQLCRGKLYGISGLQQMSPLAPIRVVGDRCHPEANILNLTGPRGVGQRGWRLKR